MWNIWSGCWNLIQFCTLKPFFNMWVKHRMIHNNFNISKMWKCLSGDSICNFSKLQPRSETKWCVVFVFVIKCFFVRLWDPWQIQYFKTNCKNVVCLVTFTKSLRGTQGELSHLTKSEREREKLPLKWTVTFFRVYLFCLPPDQPFWNILALELSKVGWIPDESFCN